LPDGTRVWLNSCSSLRFPERFDAGGRDVYLQGEAYLVVAPDARSPFRVHAGGEVITVTGTAFNVSAYDDDDTWRATLVEGSIRVGETVLAPSEQLVIRAGTRTVTRVESDLYTSWVRGRFNFRAFTFEELARKLERWYDCRVVYADESIRKRRFTGLVNKHEPVERVLGFLEMTTDIEFHVTDKTITVGLKPTRPR
jgi:ferric-dicitrate binding protein FerR (iron transport regulator)